MSKLARTIPSIAEQHPYDFGHRGPARYKGIGISILERDFLRLRDYAARMDCTMSELIRGWLAPHLREIHENPLPPPVDGD